jgi:hypothetical protein
MLNPPNLGKLERIWHISVLDISAQYFYKSPKSKAKVISTYEKLNLMFLGLLNKISSFRVCSTFSLNRFFPGIYG